jgi:hypothetical protein
LTDTEAFREAVRLVVVGVRRFGFKGRVPRLTRQLESGALQIVSLERQQPFRPPLVSVGLSVVPAALLEGIEAAAPGRRPQ